MLITLLEPVVVVLPYADEDDLCVVTHDPQSQVLIHNGLLYENTGPGEFRQVGQVYREDGVIRSAVPLGSTLGRNFFCHHHYEEDTKSKDRTLIVRCDDTNLILLAWGTQQLVFDLGTKIEFTRPKTTTLWDHLTVRD
jgi:hypothetical protein